MSQNTKQCTPTSLPANCTFSFTFEWTSSHDIRFQNSCKMSKNQSILPIQAVLHSRASSSWAIQMQKSLSTGNHTNTSTLQFTTSQLLKTICNLLFLIRLLLGTKPFNTVYFLDQSAKRDAGKIRF